MSQLDERAYQSAREAAAYYVLPRPGCLRVSGEDRQAFLQRQTTNEIAALSPEHAVLTVLTSPAARILNVFYLLYQPQAIEVITLPGSGESTARYLRSRIFFMDKVALEDVSSQFAQIHLLGPQLSALIAQLGVRDRSEPDHVTRFSHRGADLRLWASQPEFAPGCRLLFPAEVEEQLELDLQSGGATRLGELEYGALRVEAGSPAVSAELSDEFTPFEAGLSSAVSLQKGCYTGQEVLARQTTYDKVAQRLCGLKLDRPAVAGARLRSEDGRPAGRLTSYAFSPRFGPIGLAVVRRPFDEAGLKLALEIDEGKSPVKGEVVQLPF